MKKQFITSIFLIFILEEIVFAQKFENIQVSGTMTITEFCSLNLNKEISVKIQDELSPEKIHNLMLVCNGDEKDKIGPIDLDLSNCTFKNKECNIFITNLKNVRSLVLPKTTKTITFCLASDMEHIILPSGLERIEEQAFFRTNLKFIEIPESVQYVGALAFGDTKNLQYIKTFNNPYKTKWSSIWNEWNDAKILEGEADFLLKENNFKEKYGTIRFSKTVYHRAFDTIDMEICLDKEPRKSQKAVLHFYDVHNKNESAGDIKIKLKKGKKTITIKEYPAVNFFISETDDYCIIINKFSDYWIKLRCELEFSDGITIPLDGFCYIYEEPLTDGIS